jgi:hypothetical protein
MEASREDDARCRELGAWQNQIYGFRQPSPEQKAIFRVTIIRNPPLSGRWKVFELPG